MRTLFDAIHNVVTEAVLVFEKDCIQLDRYDNTQTMVVKVKLDRLDAATYFCDERLEIGLNIGMFHNALSAVVQNDVLGLCVTRASWMSGDRTIDLYIMNETDMYCYSYKCRALAIEYERVDLPRKSEFHTQISIGCTNFKRYLHDCAAQGDYVKFVPKYNREKELIETRLVPTGGPLRVCQLELILFSAVPAQFDEAKFNTGDTHEYSISSLALFTKATTLCREVVILLTNNFPLVVQYDVGDLGVLRFLLAHRIPECDTWLDDIEETPPASSTVPAMPMPMPKPMPMPVTMSKLAPSLIPVEGASQAGQHCSKKRKKSPEGRDCLKKQKGKACPVVH